MSFIIPGNRINNFLLNSHEISQIECYARKIFNKSQTTQTFQTPDPELQQESQKLHEHGISFEHQEIIQPPKPSKEKEKQCPTISTGDDKPTEVNANQTSHDISNNVSNVGEGQTIQDHNIQQKIIEFDKIRTGKNENRTVILDNLVEEKIYRMIIIGENLILLAIIFVVFVYKYI
ncbi:hypothetical protein RF11_11143 [Thelohanellus kitauei]|uniref:Uncharacterized protein n=1 Tax=Thelohanellus kitauei TaxID=669202 RepID=A0A0C2MZM2_THEKT|nr:hypothetical protein RF11_11143 [Thelohanellus kitauei]